MQLKYELLSCLLIWKSKGIPAATVEDLRFLYNDKMASVKMTLSHLWKLGLIDRTGKPTILPTRSSMKALKPSAST